MSGCRLHCIPGYRFAVFARLMNVKIQRRALWVRRMVVILHQGKSYTTSSPRIPQVLTEARVLGRSGAM